MDGIRVSLRKAAKQIVSGRKYDWGDVNRMLAGECGEVTYVCPTDEDALDAFNALRGNSAFRDGIISVSRSGREVVVGDARTTKK